MSTLNPRRLGLLAALVWLAVLVIAATAAAWRDAAPVLPGPGRTALALLAWLITALVGAALGTAVVKGAWLETFDPLERSAIRALAGLALISVAVLAIGLAGLFPPPWLAWLLSGAALAGLWRPFRQWRLDIRDGLHVSFQAETDGFTRWVRRFVVVMLALAVIMALIPPTKWDALTYHLTAPRDYLAAGRIVSQPENHFYGFPQLVEMLYLWVTLMAGPRAAAGLHAVFGVLEMLTLLGLANRFQRPLAGWLALGVLASSQAVWELFHWPYNDLALMAYTVAALALLLAQQGDGSRRARVWAGVMTGCMMGVKYSAAGLTIAVGVLAVWQARKEGFRRAAGALLLAAAAALTAFAPWMLKNLIVDGNPVSPFLFGTAAYDDLDNWYYLRPGTGMGAGDLLLMPLRASVFGRDVVPGPLLLGLLPLALVGWRRRDAAERGLIAALALFALVACGFWLAGAAHSYFLIQLRLLAPVFPALALAGSLGLDGLRQLFDGRDLMLARGLALLVLTSSLLLAGVSFAREDPLPVLAGVQTEEDYLLEQLQGHYAAMQQVNDLSQGSRILFLWEPRSFYCQMDCTPDTLINAWWHTRQTTGDPQAIAESWRSAGYTHVLIFEAGLRFQLEEDPENVLSDADVAALDSLRGTVLQPLGAEYGGYTLYTLVEETP